MPQARTSCVLRVHQTGLSLVELMLSLVLGLVMVGAVLGAYLSTRETFQTQENLARLQESGRFALEMMAREIREAGLTPCGSPLTANVLVSGTASNTPWWADTAAGALRGEQGSVQTYTGLGSAAGNQAPGTHSLLILRPSNDENFLATVLGHDPARKTVDIQASALMGPRGIALLCDSGSAALWQVDTVTSAQRNRAQLSYAASPLNCSTSLGRVDATCQSPVDKTFAAGALLVPWDPGLWYVGLNGSGQASLYRAEVVPPSAGAGTPAMVTRGVEKMPGVEGLTIDYLTRDRNQGGALATAWVQASTLAGKWADPTLEVAAVRIKLTLTAGSGNQQIRRDMQTVVGLRNR